MTAPIRPFTPPEERALVKLLGAARTGSIDVTRDRPSTYARLADRGMAIVMTVNRRKKARLTCPGRYFAELVALRRTER